MNARLGMCAAAAAAITLASSTLSAATVGIIPVTAASGSQNYDLYQANAYYDVARNFDTQAGGLSWDGSKPVTTAGTDLPAAGDQYSALVRQFGWGYVDFGPDYASVRITGTWTRLHQWTNIDAVQETMWWDNSLTNTTGIPFTGVYGGQYTMQVPNQTANLETTLKFRTIGNISGNDGLWTNNWSAASDAEAVIPAGRYLIIRAPGDAAGGGNAGTAYLGSSEYSGFMEYAFVGSVPEPASLSLLGLGGLAMMRRRRVA